MNLSGNVVRRFVDYFDIDDILVIHDDLDLPVGKVRLRARGSSGGHNGLKNIEANLGTQEYARVKIGISNDKNFDTKDYVLGRFSSDDMKVLSSVLDMMPGLFNDYMGMSFVSLMNKYNQILLYLFRVQEGIICQIVFFLILVMSILMD